MHPQSIVHSCVYYDDGSVLSQMGLPDMRSAISYALSFPARQLSGVEMLDLTKQPPLEFFPPDMKKYKCLELAYQAIKKGGNAPGTLNAANEVAFDAFLKTKNIDSDPFFLGKNFVEMSLKNINSDLAVCGRSHVNE